MSAQQPEEGDQARCTKQHKLSQYRPDGVAVAVLQNLTCLKIMRLCHWKAIYMLIYFAGINNNNNLQAFQLIVSARYLLGVPKP